VSAAFPDVLRHDTGTAAMGTRPASAAADADLRERVRRERPAGLRALTVFGDLDGATTLVYAQWADEAAHLAWWRTYRSGPPDPGELFTVHRSHLPDDAAGRRPSMLATPRFATEGPGTQRALADTVLGVLAELRPDGLLGAHFHLSANGRRVVNYAEWTDTDAWRAFADGPAADRMRTAFAATPGATPLNSPLGVARYRLQAVLWPAGEDGAVAGAAAVKT
jgi:hypothetical protein